MAVRASFLRAVPATASRREAILARAPMFSSVSIRLPFLSVDRMRHEQRAQGLSLHQVVQAGGRAPFMMTAGMPAAMAISAACSLVTMPPVPRLEPAPPASFSRF